MVIRVLYSPGENETQQGADENEHLVEHSRMGPLDGPVEVILRLWEELLDFIEHTCRPLAGL